MINLKPCPFCGGSPICDEIILPFEDDKFGWRIYCEDCGCVLIQESKTEVITDWNRRVKEVTK